jgi:hypothetical protein
LICAICRASSGRVWIAGVLLDLFDGYKQLSPRRAPKTTTVRVADCTSNQSSPRVVFAARARPLRIAASTVSGDVPTISITRLVWLVMASLSAIGG